MLLVEYTVLDKLQVINEGTKANKRLKVLGKFQKCDEQNNNGRVYPRKILANQVKAIQEKIGDRSLVGALDHPANDASHLSQASHVITKLWVEKNGDVMGEAEILSTPNGKIVEALLNDNVKIGISSRGLGSVSEGTTGKVVNEDFKLITFDLVSDPSTKGAFPGICESMRENSQRAQAIVSKHKKDRVLLTMLESKINKALKGKQKKLDRNKNGKLDSEDFELLRGNSNQDEGSMGEKSEFPDLNGDGKTTFADILVGKLKGKKGKKVKKVEEGKKAPDETKPNRTDYTGMSANQVINTPVYPTKPRNKPDNTTAETELNKNKKAKKKTLPPLTDLNITKETKDKDPLRLNLLRNQEPASESASFKESISKAVNTYLSELNRSERHEVEQGSKDMDDISLGRDRRHTPGERHSPRRGEKKKKVGPKPAKKKPAKKRTASRDEYKRDGEVTHGRNFSY